MESSDPMMDLPPKYGLKFPLNHTFPIQTKQVVMPTVKQAIGFVPLTARYTTYYVIRRMHNKRPIMDYMSFVKAQRNYGCPIGGIGGGTIGRGFRGEFCRFQLCPGMYKYVTVPECQFIVNIQNEKKETIFQSVLSTYKKPKKAPPSWQWKLDPAECEYTGLYPRAWTTYDLSKYGVKLVCRQVSPVIPHNYKDSSLPCAVFVFTAQNVSEEQRHVSITLTWTEVLGGDKKKSIAKLDLERYSEEHTCGVSLEQKVAGIPCTFTIAKRKNEDETIHEGYCLWNSTKTSDYVWECLKTKGKLEPDSNLAPPPPKGSEENDKKEKTGKIHKCDSIGLSSVITLNPGGIGSTELCLAWDMPVIKYKKEKVQYKRYYTKFFGSDGIAGPSIAAYALKHYKNWEKQLDEWQNPILLNSNIPDWLKGALMNELYFVADGGTIWFDVKDEFPETDPRHEYGLFGYLEGHEYRMYNTYDVHFYASFALAQLWPNLQVVLQYMFRDTIVLETEKSRVSLADGKTVKYKVKNSIPHDLGEPEGVPFEDINAYNIHDVSEWRDLNLKFVLQVLRDYRLLKRYSAPFANERYADMAYIDDVRAGTEDDLYSRSTGQTSPDSGTSPTRVISAECVTSPTCATSTECVTSAECVTSPTSAASSPRASPAPQRARVTRITDILELLYSSPAEESLENTDQAASLRSPLTDELGQPGGASGSSGAAWCARRYASDMYASCVSLVRRAQLWDKDGDGLIENGGFPDQTYDAWVMSGPSAYCGGLWIASLVAVVHLAQALGHKEDEQEFSALLEKARASYDEKLWNGSYYKFDVKPANAKVVMADQLAGHWYLRASGITESIFPESKVRKALASVYQYNVMQFKKGKMGAVNGYMATPRGHADSTAIQSFEVWIGVTYGVAALMIYEGMHEEAFVTAGGLYDTLTKMGLAYETPEALFENGNHRSLGYMRPLCIWAMYQAILARPGPPAAQTNGSSNHVKQNGL